MNDPDSTNSEELTETGRGASRQFLLYLLLSGTVQHDLVGLQCKVHALISCTLRGAPA